MLSIAATEDVIGSLIEELLVVPLAQPPFALTLHPGDLDDRAIGARGVSSVILRFKSINFEDKASINPLASCFAQVNVVNWEILVNNNNLRTHRDTYSIAQAIIRKLRGRKLLVSASGDTFAQSYSEVTEFRYMTFDENKSCNKAVIVVSSRFTDTYPGV